MSRCQGACFLFYCYGDMLQDLLGSLSGFQESLEPMGTLMLFREEEFWIVGIFLDMAEVLV